MMGPEVSKTSVSASFRCSQAGWEERCKETALHKPCVVYPKLGNQGRRKDMSYFIGKERALRGRKLRWALRDA